MVMAMAPPVHEPPAGGGAATQAVFATQSSHPQAGHMAGSAALVICLEAPTMSQVTDALLHELAVGQVMRFPGLVTVCPGVSVPTVIGKPGAVVAPFVHVLSLGKYVS